MATLARLSQLVLAVATLVVPALAPAQSRTELEKILRRKVLANGMEVIVVENHGVPLATLEIDVKNGAFTQSPEFAGLAHLYEHMFFKANQAYPEPEAFVNRVSELGANFNATTREENVNYYFTIPSDSIEGGMRFIASALRTPLFRRDELERERQVVIGEYDRAESSPFFHLQNAMTRKLYPGQFSRKNIIGDRQVILTTTPEKMRAIQRKYYVPNNSALIVTGDVNPERVFALAERVFGDWQRQPDPFAADPVPPIPALTANDAVITEAPVSAVTVMVQWQGPSVGKDPEATYAADVFSDVLNSAVSRFQQRLVDSGLWQSILVNYYTLNQVGPITISGQTSPGKLREAMAALHAEIEKFDDPGYITAPEVEAVKAQRALGGALGIERASGIAHTIGFWWSVKDVEYFMGYADNMARQTVGDLHRYARQYIIGKPRISGVLLSPQDRQALRLTTEELATMGSGKVGS